MKLQGIAASEGFAYAKVYQLTQDQLDIPQAKITDSTSALKKLKKAMQLAENEIRTIKAKSLKTLDQKSAMVFDAHIQILNDPELLKQVHQLIETDLCNPAKAYDHVARTYANMFEMMESDYMKERAVDVLDVSRRVLGHLLDKPSHSPALIAESVIVIAHDLTPSDTAQLNKEFVQGFITNVGGKTSHSAIMARNLEIPAIVGVGQNISVIKHGDFVMMDGTTGEVFINPDAKTVEYYQSLEQNRLETKKLWEKYKDKPSLTKDGKKLEIAANIGSSKDIEHVLKSGAEGVGLFRTEFLYMNSNHFPTEIEQVEVYQKVLKAFKDQKVVIRTLDIGGDKSLDYLKMPKELNPFLGRRALRLCLDEKPLFKTQLRALLKANRFGNLHIMFPMVATLEELDEAKELLEVCEKELLNEGLELKPYKIGIMIEIPSAVLLADQFAQVVDFFSIGTNDLIQYTFAADRMNESVSYLYQPFHPVILKMIKIVVEASNKHGIWTGMCGEMAQETKALKLLVGLGLYELSMSSSSVLKLRTLLSELDYQACVNLSNKALELKSSQAVIDLIDSNQK